MHLCIKYSLYTDINHKFLYRLGQLGVYKNFIESLQRVCYLNNWDHEVDFLAIGSGGGGMTAALTAHEYGLDTLVIEKADVYGGTTALSGGVIWIPNNHHMASAKIDDSEEEALVYLEQVVSDDVPKPRLHAYIKQSPQMLKFLEEISLVKYAAAAEYPDYYAELKGGKPGARSLDPKPFTRKQLGEDLVPALRLSGLRNPNGFSMTADEAHQLFCFTWRSHYVLVKRLLGYWLDIPSRLKKSPDRRLTLGKALVARLRASMRNAEIPLWLNTSAKELIKENNRVIGLVCEKEGETLRIKVNKGLLIASGGFAHNAELRQEFHHTLSNAKWTAACKTDTGDGITIGRAVGAQLAMMNYAWWTPTMVMPEGHADAFIAGRSLPGCMIVDKSGKRFLNEAEPYEDFVKHQYANHSEASSSIPAYFIFDSHYRHEYPVARELAPGKYRPDSVYKHLFDSGWVKKAETLDELAVLCGIDTQGLAESVRKMGIYAQQGIDEDFGKGSNLNDVYYSDHRVTPNPCLAPIEKAPFYAIEIWPGDLGTKGGLVTDENARVLDINNQIIEGLYATGNASASVMGDSYPGAGCTIGASMTFGYIAARHAAVRVKGEEVKDEG